MSLGIIGLHDYLVMNRRIGNIYSVRKRLENNERMGSQLALPVRTL